MDSSSSLCFGNSGFGVLSTVKGLAEFHGSRYPIWKLGREPTSLKHACILLDKSTKRIDVSTTDLHFTRFVNDCEIGTRRTDDSVIHVSKNEVMDEEPMAKFYALTHAPERHYVIGALSLCGRDGNLELGRGYHTLVMKIGLGLDEFVGTSLIDMYAKCGDMESAVRLFNMMPCSDVATYNCLISGYARNELFDQAFHLFVEIESMGIGTNDYTYSTMLATCGILSASEEGKQLHARVIKMQYLSNTAVGNALLTMYCKCVMMDEAETLFENILEKNIISWTAIINGFYQLGDFEKALKLFSSMRENGVDPNEHTFTIAVASCGSVKDVDSGRMLHAMIIKKGMALGNFVGSAIIDMYSELAEMDYAERQIKYMGKAASIVSWNALIAGFIRNEKIEEAMKAFNDMVKIDAACNEFTYSILLKACSSLPSLATCQQTHARVLKAKLELNTHVGSSLIEAYTKSGSLENAEKVFSQLSVPDVVSWNSMIKAYSQHSCPRKAIFLFRKMIEEGNRPSSSTFLAILSSCSHTGLIKEGQEFFKSMVRDHGIPPEERHYSCMVDLLGRAGKLEDALEFINNLPTKPTTPIWRPLLAACRCHNNLEMAEYVANQILELHPDDATVYVTLSNMYTELGRHADAEKQRKLMTQRNITKEPGFSWIEVNDKIHKFFSGDNMHPESPQVYHKLKELRSQIKDISHALGADICLVPEAELGQAKEDIALYHSEKLAVCFGLVKLPARKPIRVFKNLRVCKDCHSFIKCISRITERDIVLRDNYRFHNFKQGHCSCEDYW